MSACFVVLCSCSVLFVCCGVRCFSVFVNCLSLCGSVWFGFSNRLRRCFPGMYNLRRFYKTIYGEFTS